MSRCELFVYSWAKATLTQQHNQVKYELIKMLLNAIEEDKEYDEQASRLVVIQDTLAASLKIEESLIRLIPEETLLSDDEVFSIIANLMDVSKNELEQFKNEG